MTLTVIKMLFQLTKMSATFVNINLFMFKIKEKEISYLHFIVTAFTSNMCKYFVIFLHADCRKTTWYGFFFLYGRKWHFFAKVLKCYLLQYIYNSFLFSPFFRWKWQKGSNCGESELGPLLHINPPIEWTNFWVKPSKLDLSIKKKPIMSTCSLCAFETRKRKDK